MKNKTRKRSKEKKMRSNCKSKIRKSWLGSRSWTILTLVSSISKTIFLKNQKKHLDFQAKSAHFPSGYLLQLTFVLRAHGALRIDWLLEAPLADQLEVIGFPASERARFSSELQAGHGRAIPAAGGCRRAAAAELRANHLVIENSPFNTVMSKSPPE